MTYAPELLPCPFCGKDAGIDRDHGIEERHAFGCWPCGIWFDDTNCDDPQAAWNTRAPSDTVHATVAAVEKQGMEREATIADAAGELRTADDTRSATHAEAGDETIQEPTTTADEMADHMVQAANLARREGLTKEQTVNVFSLFWASLDKSAAIHGEAERQTRPCLSQNSVHATQRR